jgi:hypothetical protein
MREPQACIVPEPIRIGTAMTQRSGHGRQPSLIDNAAVPSEHPRNAAHFVGRWYQTNGRLIEAPAKPCHTLGSPI